MAISDWNFGTHGPEILVDVGTVGLSRSVNYSVLSADFGDGYFASVLTGDIAGNRSWKCNWSNTRKDIFGNPGLVIPLYDDGTIVEGPSAGVALSFSITPGTRDYVTNATYGDMQPRMIYLQRFFARHCAQGGMPFVFVDPGEYGPSLNISDPFDYSGAQKWLARFKTSSIQFTQGNRSNFWSYSAEIITVRPGYY